MITLHDLIGNCFNKENNIYIPLIQRNYKWCSEKAEEFASNLFKSYIDGKGKYTLGMVTLYRENDNTFQLIDGQQRIITLTLILKFLAAEIQYFNFSFERDEGLDESVVTRSKFLQDISVSIRDKSEMYTDIKRFKENIEAIEYALTMKNKNDEVLEKYCYTSEHKEEFINYILNQTYILIHFSEAEPIEEFLNINKNKTRFGINDHIKANLMMDAPEQVVNYSRQDILHLFKNLSNSLFAQEDIWKLVKQGYDIKEDKEIDGFENRLKVLFSDRYEDKEKSKLGYETIPEYKRLQYYNEIINNICYDLEADNWNSYNGINYIHSINGQRFFDLFDKNYKEEIMSRSLEEVLLDFITKKPLYAKNCFIQSQLQFEKMEVDELQKLILSNEWKNDHNKWLYTAKNEFDEFKKFYKEYINEKYSEQEK